MAKQCCICEKNIGILNGFTTLDNNKLACDDCYSIISDYIKKIWDSETTESIDEIKKNAESAISVKARELKNPQILLNIVNDTVEKKTKFILQKKQKEISSETETDSSEIGDIYETLRKKLLLTTAGTLEGYKVKKQLGVVFGETVFKPSAGQQFTSVFGDMFRSLSFSAKEMKGQVGIIEEARKFAYIKMMKSALDSGANAIIAIDSDNTIGESICYLSLYGTAVYVEPET